MKRAHGDLELMLVAEGPWNLAFDASAVAKIVHVQAEVGDRRLSDLLQIPCAASPPRSYLLLDASSAPRIAVESIVALHRPDLSALQPLAGFLKHVGVPSWLRGTYVTNDILYFLIDLIAAYDAVANTQDGR